MNVEIVENRKALTTVRNKKKELKDLDNHAYQAGSETSSNVVDALDSVDHRSFCNISSLRLKRSTAMSIS